MKTLKRILATFLAATALFSAVGCGHTHQYVDQTTEATCGVDGKVVYTCSCGDTYEEVLPATGEHDFVDYICGVCNQEEYDFITIAEALTLCGEEGNITQDRYYIKATVKSVTKAEYGAMIIQDATGEIAVYGTYSADGAVGYAKMTEKPYKGDLVVLHCILQNFSGTKEVKNARLISFKPIPPEVDENAYTETTVAGARAAVAGTKVKVDGVVAKIAYANGKVPCGVYLVDETQSIYVYDVDLAGRVQIGNKVTIAASKAYWILEKEQDYAAKFRYAGCNQLEDVTLLENDNGKHEPDYSWVQTATVKEIMQTPVTQDITTTIYKVNALVKKVPGDGFVNYYFQDLDGTTGSYTYTQCNGSDFAWLDEFDGKICTVYLSPINAKSTAAACGFRFFPVKVVDEGFAFDKANAGKFAVEYYGVDQFESVYYADPEKELQTSVSSDLLGFEGATLSYVSSNEDSVYFENKEGKTYLRCKDNGKATVTVTGKYGEYAAFEKTVEIEVLNPDQFDTISVADAIAAPIDSKVLVRGIVGPSVVNKNGFYLFGADGSVISVLVDTVDEFKGLEIGNEIILEGMRERYVKNDSAAYAGQTCIVNAKVVVNIYGNTPYSTAKAVEKTPEEFYALDVEVDYSTTVFVVKGTVKLGTGYSPVVQISGESGYFSLYHNSSKQYTWLLEYLGQEVTIEVAACNWNDKNYWRGCVLAVRLADGTKVYNTLNFDSYA